MELNYVCKLAFMKWVPLSKIKQFNEADLTGLVFGTL